MLQIFGRFHILVLHLPIGFLVLAFLMEIASRLSASSLRPAVGFSLLWGMVSAVFAAIFGYLLSLEGGYETPLLDWHKWLGIATAGLSIVLYLFHNKRPDSSLLLPLFTLMVLTLAAASHFGGSLTHGSGFIFSDKNEAASTPVHISNLDSALVFEQVVLPVLETKCGNCHNAAKHKGGLVVLTKEGLLKGGKNGPAILPQNPAASALLKATHLPLEAKEHMPPKGKPQLSDTEKQLLDWWLKADAPFDKTVAAAAMPAALRSALKASAVPTSVSMLDGIKIEPVGEDKLKKLRSEGIQVFPLATGSPFLQVLFSGKKDISLQQLSKLKPIVQNIVQINFANSNVDDAMLAIVKELPHLNRLHLDQTAVTDKGLAHLAGLQYLEYLNLYNTKVTDTGLAQLQSLPKLRSLYLWQSGVTADGVAKFASLNPSVRIDNGIQNDSMFSGKLALKPPQIKASKMLFMDTVQVALEAGFAKVKIHYTFDGKQPDSTSAVYGQPIVMNKSGELKAIAYLEGWTTSPVVAMSFVKVRYQPTAVSLALQPDPRYKGDGEKTLIDLQRGGDSFKSGKWHGWQGHDCIATIDLGKVTDVSKVSVGGFEDTGGWIFFPKGMRISTSSDGKTFKRMKDSKYPVPQKESKTGAKMFTETFASTQARYVKVEVMNVLKNPKWHDKAGEPSWVFIDEILVE